MNRKKEKKLSYIVLVIFAVLFILPLCWVILASLDSNANIAAKIPNLTMNNYKDILASSTTWYSLKNGLILSLGTAILTVVLAGLLAYPLSRYEMKYKKIFMLGMLFMTSLPITTVMVPVYKLFVMVKLYDNLAGVVLFMTAANLPYAIWMMKNFMDSVPISLEEAAWIDGASKLKALTKVVIPLMFAGVSSVGIFVFSNCWGNFQAPFLLLITSERCRHLLHCTDSSEAIPFPMVRWPHSQLFMQFRPLSCMFFHRNTCPKVLLWKVEQKAEPVIQATCYKKMGGKINDHDRYLQTDSGKPPGLGFGESDCFPELQYLFELSRAKEGKHDEVLASAIQKLDSYVSENGCITKEICTELEKELSFLAPAGQKN